MRNSAAVPSSSPTLRPSTGRDEPAGGTVYSNPLGRAPLDQIGLGLAWNRVNRALYGDSYVNPSETTVELYWSWSVKHLLITPDVQLYFQPALTPTQSMAAVFSLRVTVLF
jgi:carbohydrate-selective porin OprB